mgnify:CR=1 FL=1
MEKLLINLDGASQGNPGNASYGVVITDPEGNVLEELGSYIGRTTNNVAEYRALIAGAEAVQQYMPKRALFFMDSQLVVNQVNGLYRVRQPHLNALYEQSLQLLNKLPHWEVKYVERTANWQAHRVAQRALFERSGPNSKASKTSKNSTLEMLNFTAEQLSDYDLRKVVQFAQRLLDESDD